MGMNLSGLEVAEQRTFVVIEPGEYEVEVEECVWEEVKSGPRAGQWRFVVDLRVVGGKYDGEGIRQWVSPTFTDRRTGKDVIAPDFANLARAAAPDDALFPAAPAERDSVGIGSDEWAAKVCEGILSARGVATVINREGQDYIDDNGEKKKGNKRHFIQRMKWEEPEGDVPSDLFD